MGVTRCGESGYLQMMCEPLLQLRAFEVAIDEYSVSEQRTRRKRETFVDFGRTLCSYEANSHLIADVEGSVECACLHNEHMWWHCRNKSEWRYSYCATCDMRMGTCHEIGDRPRFPCTCHSSFCVISDYHLVKAKWPIRFISAQCSCRGKECEVTNGTALAEHCFCVSLSTAHPKCALIDSWEYSKCAHCIWNGECMRSDHLNYEHNCICLKDSLTSCYVVDELDEEDSSQRHVLRIRRDSKKLYEKILSRYDGLLAAYSMCTCPTNDTCTSLHGDLNGTICLCFFNKKNGHVWPCYPPDFWIERRCKTCSSLGDCVFSDGDGDLACVCAPIIRMCVRIDEAIRDTDDTSDSNATATGKSALRLADRIIKMWEISSTTEPPRIIKEQEQKEKAFGLKGMSDPIAIKAKASENLIFAVNNLNDTDKSSISYSKQEFITKCSFNGRQCSVETDFSSYIDPSFGNCFTFNFNSTENMTSERAGPSYGLRFQVFVNVSDYLPTTEAAGVRLTVHSPDEQPFPDTHGHSAPTGFVSSFGIRLKRMERLSSPYGDCVKDGKNDDFIYKDKNYTTEGCQRSCIQKYLVSKCGCGDPRFPPFRSIKNCPVDDPDLRDCLHTEITYAARYIDQIGCVCRQPCKQLVYSVSYSASRWPASTASLTDCIPGLSPMQCLNFYREQGALIEVFFEQLNYESLLEGEAYGLPNLLSDFGGQLGLWMGVSVITIMEFGILTIDVLMTIVCCRGKDDNKKESKRSYSSRNGSQKRYRANDKVERRSLSAPRVCTTGITDVTVLSASNRWQDGQGSASYACKFRMCTVAGDAFGASAEHAGTITSTTI